MLEQKRAKTKKIDCQPHKHIASWCSGPENSKKSSQKKTKTKTKNSWNHCVLTLWWNQIKTILQIFQKYLTLLLADLPWLEWFIDGPLPNFSSQVFWPRLFSKMSGLLWTKKHIPDTFLSTWRWWCQSPPWNRWGGFFANRHAFFGLDHVFE